LIRLTSVSHSGKKIIKPEIYTNQKGSLNHQWSLLKNARGDPMCGAEW
jgi:hypothetical protein